MKSTSMLVFSVALIVIGVIGLVFGISILMDVGRPGQTVTYGTAFCTLGLSLPFLIGGGVLFVNVRRTRARARQEAVEAKVLQVAMSRNGRVTAAEIAMVTDLSLAEAQAYLEQLARSGTITVEVGSQGMLVYNFSNIHA